MADQDEYARYRDDAEVLASIGAEVGRQAGRVSVRLPRNLAEAAVAAWARDETGPAGAETPAQWVLRDQAADLALIGLAISERGRPDGEAVTVDLDLGTAGAAIRAALR